MDKHALLTAAMARRCRDVILNAHPLERVLPRALQAKHLEWMCNQVEEHAEDWPMPKLHRWIGFVQCGLLANRMLDLEAAKTMFDEAMLAHGEEGEDLLDHLDPKRSYHMEADRRD